MNLLPKDKLIALNKKWSEPDSKKGYSWPYDGVRDTPNHWMGYNHELRGGLDLFNCLSFDELVIWMNQRLGYQADVIDLMGGAYFLENPENTNLLTGIRVHDKDRDFLELYDRESSSKSSRVKKIIYSSNRTIIEADILKQEDWDRIYSLNKRAHLLVCRPVGVFDSYRSMANNFDNPAHYCNFYSWLFDNARKLLNPNSIFFTEIPDVFDDQSVYDFFNHQDIVNGTITQIYFVPDADYNCRGHQRRYAVILNGLFTTLR